MTSIPSKIIPFLVIGVVTALLGVVENLPIVVESQDETQLKSDITDALVACIEANPKLIQDIVSIKIPA